MHRRRAALHLLGLAASLLAAGCGGGDSGPQETGLKPEPETVAADEAMQNLAKKHTRKGAH